MDEVLRIENLHKRFGDLEVLKGINLSVEKGETVVILGASGSGKSTLLRCLNFLEIPTEGRIHLEGREIGAIRPGSCDRPVPSSALGAFPGQERVPDHTNTETCRSERDQAR